MSDHDDRHDLILHLFGELDDTRSAELEDLLNESPELREERERLRLVIERYRSEGEEDPPQVAIPSLLGSGETRRRKGPAPRRLAFHRMFHIAALLLVAAASFIAGRATVTRDAIEGTGEIGDIQALAVEAAHLRRRAALLAMEHEWATTRIAAIEDVTDEARTDPSLAAALWTSLRDDPSANVRLAVVDALYSAPEIVPPSADLERLLGSEPEVAIRLAFVGWLASAQPEGWEAALRASGASDHSAAVRSRARELVGGAV